MTYFPSRSSTLVTFPARLNGAAADGINSPSTQTIKFPPAADSPRKLQTPARKRTGHCLVKSGLQLGKNNGCRFGLPLARGDIPSHTAALSLPPQTCVHRPELLTRHTVGTGRSCLIRDLQSNAAHYLNFPSLMIVIKHPSASPSTPPFFFFFFQVVDFIRQTRGTIASNDVKW